MAGKPERLHLKAFVRVLTQPQLLTLANLTRGRSDWVLLVSAVALVGLTIAVFYFWNALRKARTGGSGSSSKDLFVELCAAHELNRLERTLILQLASTYEMPQPAALFIDPWTLEQAAAAPGPEAHRYGALRQRLFGSLE
jgi:hypothetical protein